MCVCVCVCVWVCVCIMEYYSAVKKKRMQKCPWSNMDRPVRYCS